MTNDPAKPMILVDLKKYRIRIHRNTLCDIGNPTYVFLLVNPEKHALALLRSTRFNAYAHRVSTAHGAVELYSQSLIRSLCDICGNLQNCRSYRLYGDVIRNEGVAMFFIPEAVPLKGVQ